MKNSKEPVMVEFDILDMQKVDGGIPLLRILGPAFAWYQAITYFADNFAKGWESVNDKTTYH